MSLMKNNFILLTQPDIQDKTEGLKEKALRLIIRMIKHLDFDTRYQEELFPICMEFIQFSA